MIPGLNSGTEALPVPDSQLSVPAASSSTPAPPATATPAWYRSALGVSGSRRTSSTAPATRQPVAAGLANIQATCPAGNAARAPGCAQ